jgi:hypothetical protein
MAGLMVPGMMTTISTTFSPLTLLVMLIILAAATWVFTTLVSRETLRRADLSLSNWARSRKLRVIDVEDHPPDQSAVAALSSLHPKLRRLLQNNVVRIMQVRTDDPPQLKMTSPLWNLLMLRMDANWPPTGLRPAERSISVIDLFALSSFASLAPNLSFMVFGAEPWAARAFPASTIAAILPPDVGLLLHGPDLILDFTGREFDEIELTRMMELADELAQLLLPAESKKSQGGIHAD